MINYEKNKIHINFITLLLLLLSLCFAMNKAQANEAPAAELLNSLQTLSQNQKNAEPQVMLLVSFSLPEASLKQYIAQAAYLDIPLYIRGLYQNSLLATQQKIARLLGEDIQGGLAIDPTKFSQFNIERVPTLVIAQDKQRFDVVSGHVSLQALIEAINDRGAYGQTMAATLLGRIQTWQD
ncbi:MAG: type-F conjugative transfer system pilin assembly protein TrbC [Gammaproteobacteria bacterium]